MILANATAYSLTSLFLGLGAAVAYATPALASARLSAATTRLLLWCAWGLHGLAVLWSLFGDVPRFGFAPALSVTAWLGLTVYAVESYMYPKLKAVWVFAAIGAASVILAMLFPGQTLHSAASKWLPVHWALGLIRIVCRCSRACLVDDAFGKANALVAQHHVCHIEWFTADDAGTINFPIRDRRFCVVNSDVAGWLAVQ
jgi:hypothetical protein